MDSSLRRILDVTTEFSPWFLQGFRTFHTYAPMSQTGLCPAARLGPCIALVSDCMDRSLRSRAAETGHLPRNFSNLSLCTQVCVAENTCLFGSQ